MSNRMADTASSISSGDARSSSMSGAASAVQTAVDAQAQAAVDLISVGAGQDAHHQTRHHNEVLLPYNGMFLPRMVGSPGGMSSSFLDDGPFPHDGSTTAFQDALQQQNDNLYNAGMISQELGGNPAGGSPTDGSSSSVNPGAGMGASNPGLLQVDSLDSMCDGLNEMLKPVLALHKKIANEIEDQLSLKSASSGADDNRSEHPSNPSDNISSHRSNIFPQLGRISASDGKEVVSSGTQHVDDQHLENPSATLVAPTAVQTKPLVPISHPVLQLQSEIWETLNTINKTLADNVSMSGDATESLLQAIQATEKIGQQSGRGTQAEINATEQLVGKQTPLLVPPSQATSSAQVPIVPVPVLDTSAATQARAVADEADKDLQLALDVLLKMGAAGGRKDDVTSYLRDYRWDEDAIVDVVAANQPPSEFLPPDNASSGGQPSPGSPLVNPKMPNQIGNLVNPQMPSLVNPNIVQARGVINRLQSQMEQNKKLESVTEANIESVKELAGSIEAMLSAKQRVDVTQLAGQINEMLQPVYDLQQEIQTALIKMRHKIGTAAIDQIGSAAMLQPGAMLQPSIQECPDTDVSNLNLARMNDGSQTQTDTTQVSDMAQSIDELLRKGYGRTSSLHEEIDQLLSGISPQVHGQVQYGGSAPSGSGMLNTSNVIHAFQREDYFCKTDTGMINYTGIVNGAQTYYSTQTTNNQAGAPGYITEGIGNPIRNTGHGFAMPQSGYGVPNTRHIAGTGHLPNLDNNSQGNLVSSGVSHDPGITQMSETTSEIYTVMSGDRSLTNQPFIRDNLSQRSWVDNMSVSACDPTHCLLSVLLFVLPFLTMQTTSILRQCSRGLRTFLNAPDVLPYTSYFLTSVTNKGPGHWGMGDSWMNSWRYVFKKVVNIQNLRIIHLSGNNSMQAMNVACFTKCLIESALIDAVRKGEYVVRGGRAYGAGFAMGCSYFQNLQKLSVKIPHSYVVTWHQRMKKDARTQKTPALTTEQFTFFVQCISPSLIDQVDLVMCEPFREIIPLRFEMLRFFFVYWCVRNSRGGTGNFSPPTSPRNPGTNAGGMNHVINPIRDPPIPVDDNQNNVNGPHNGMVVEARSGMMIPMYDYGQDLQAEVARASTQTQNEDANSSCLAIHVRSEPAFTNESLEQSRSTLVSYGYNATVADAQLLFECDHQIQLLEKVQHYMRRAGISPSFFSFQ